MDKIAKNWWLVLLKGILLIALAIFVFRQPVGTILVLAVYIGIVLLVTGLTLIVVSLSARKEMDNWGWRLAEGLLDVLFGFVLVANPGVTAVVLPFLIGFWAIFYGILMFVDAFAAKSAGMDQWWLQLILGVLMVLFGDMVAFNPVVGIMTVTIWIGLAMLIAGIFNVILALGLRKLKKAVE